MGRVLVFGLGRMGISQASLYNLFHPGDRRQIFVFDPSWKIRTAVSLTTRWHEIRAVRSLNKSFINACEAAFVCSPPLYHGVNLRQLAGFRGKIFIEKPGFVDPGDLVDVEPSQVYVGYVLRHAPVLELVDKFINGSPIALATVSLKTNAVFGGSDPIWRNSPVGGGGLVNEFGSHCINLLMKYAPEQLRLVDVKKVSDNETFAMLMGQTSGVPYEVRLSSARLDVRKAVYELEIKLKDGREIWTDLNSIRYTTAQGVTTQSMAGSELGSRGYLRGHEFSNQMKYFIQEDDYGTSFGHSVLTDKILSQIND